MQKYSSILATKYGVTQSYEKKTANTSSKEDTESEGMDSNCSHHENDIQTMNKGNSLSLDMPHNNNTGVQKAPGSSHTYTNETKESANVESCNRFQVGSPKPTKAIKYPTTDQKGAVNQTRSAIILRHLADEKLITKRNTRQEG